MDYPPTRHSEYDSRAPEVSDMEHLLDVAAKVRHENLPLDVADALDALVQSIREEEALALSPRASRRRGARQQSGRWWRAAGGRVSTQQMAKPRPVPMAEQNRYLVDTL